MVGWNHRLNGHESEQTPGDLPNTGIEPRSPALQADSLPAEPPGKHLVEPNCILIEINQHTHSVCVVIS